MLQQWNEQAMCAAVQMVKIINITIVLVRIHNCIGEDVQRPVPVQSLAQCHLFLSSLLYIDSLGGEQAASASVTGTCYAACEQWTLSIAIVV
jgi:hypothetical protein